MYCHGIIWITRFQYSENTLKTCKQFENIKRLWKYENSLKTWKVKSHWKHENLKSLYNLIIKDCKPHHTYPGPLPSSWPRSWSFFRRFRLRMRQRQPPPRWGRSKRPPVASTPGWHTSARPWPRLQNWQPWNFNVN